MELIDRAERAERTASALERRLDEAEDRLEVAQRERTTLAASLEQARRDLTVALQREFAEQRMRAELEGDATGALAQLETEIAQLGADHEAAEARADALAQALEEARQDVDQAHARAEADRQAVAVDEHRDGLRQEVGELQALAEGLHGSLMGEQAAREGAEQALHAEREQAVAEISLLQHELDRRAQVHDAVTAQIGELRSALEGVRGRAERTAELEEAIATMEGEQRRTSVRLSDTRELLTTREAEFADVEVRLAAREAELEALKEEAEGHRAARREVEAGVAFIHARSAELEHELEEERRRRERVEERLEAERKRYAAAEQGLREELETSREAADERLVAVQRTVEALRAELTAAVTELEERAAVERTARLAVERELEQERAERAAEDAVDAERLALRLEAVESELADTQAAAARERARGERLAAELEGVSAGAAEERTRAEAATASIAAHVAREHEVQTALDVLRGELAQARTENRDRAEREAAVEVLVGDLVDTAHGLRVGFERELEHLTGKRDAEIAREREGFAAEFAEMERRVGELRRQLTEAAEQLREELDAERSARRAAEAELAREVDERAQAEERTAEKLEALTQELARLRVETASNPFYDVAPSRHPVPSADHPALAQPAAAGGAPAVVGDLVRAMDRLRAAAGDPAAADAGQEVEAPMELEGSGAEDAETPPELADVEPPVPEGSEDAETSAPVGPEDDADASPIDPPAPLEDAALAMPVPPPPPARTEHPVGAAGAETPWFSERLAAFASVDEAAAERLLLASIAAQATAIAKDVTYELELPRTGRYRVEVVHGKGVSVAPVDAARPGEVEFRIEAPVAAVSALAGGAAPRRLANVTVRGRRRRLRRLLRALGAPVGLSRLQAAGARPRPADLLAMLCDGVPAEAVVGTELVVVYDVAASPGEEGSRVVVRARPDGRLGLEPDGTTSPDVTLSLDVPELLAVLAGGTPKLVTGDATAADTLHGWLRAVQGA